MFRNLLIAIICLAGTNVFADGHSAGKIKDGYIGEFAGEVDDFDLFPRISPFNIKPNVTFRTVNMAFYNELIYRSKILSSDARYVKSQEEHLHSYNLLTPLPDGRKVYFMCSLRFGIRGDFKIGTCHGHWGDPENGLVTELPPVSEYIEEQLNRQFGK